MTVQRRSRHAPGGHEMVEKPEAITEYNKSIFKVKTFFIYSYT